MKADIYLFYLGLFWIINIATLFEQPWSSDSDRSNEIFLSFLLTKWNHCINHIMKGMACKKHCQVFTKHIQKKIKWIKELKKKQGLFRIWHKCYYFSSEWPKLHFQIQLKPKAEDWKVLGLWLNTEAEVYVDFFL